MSAARSHILLKRAYDPPAESDGARVLVDRLWPRGLTKQAARVDAWLRDLAPSNELRKWFHAHREQWMEFRERYLQELRGHGAVEAVHHLSELISANDHLTLLFASKNTEQNNAVVLKEVMEGTKKPSHATRLASGQVRARKGRVSKRQ